MEDKDFCRGIREDLAFIRAASEMALPDEYIQWLQEEGMFMEEALPES